MPEWYLAIAILALVSALGIAWRPLLAALPLLGLAAWALVVQAAVSAAGPHFGRADRSLGVRLRLYGLTVLLYLLQPAARLRGRLSLGLTPWRRRGAAPTGAPWPRTLTAWWPRGRSATEHLADISQTLREAGAVVRPGGDFDRWDLEVRLGALGAVRILMATEEHGGGKQLLRFRVLPWVSPAWLAVVAVGLLVGVSAAASQAWMAALSLGVGAGLVLTRALADSGRAIDAVQRALDRTEPEVSPEASEDRIDIWQGTVERVA
jgi:hypothetical protein